MEFKAQDVKLRVEASGNKVERLAASRRLAYLQPPPALRQPSTRVACQGHPALPQTVLRTIECRVQGAGFRVQGYRGSGVQGFGVQGLGFSV